MNSRGIPTTQQQQQHQSVRSPMPQHNSPMGSPMPNGGGGQQHFPHAHPQSPAASLPQQQQINSQSNNSMQQQQQTMSSSSTANDDLNLDFLNSC